MFGNAPRALWSRWLAPDELSRIPLACRALLVEHAGKRVLEKIPVNSQLQIANSSPVTFHCTIHPSMVGSINGSAAPAASSQATASYGYGETPDTGAQPEFPGIPPSLIRNGISNSRRTLGALRVLDCKKGVR